MTKQNFARELADLTSVGPAMVRDFQMLGVKNIGHLATQDPKEMYERLCRITGERQDVCVLDTFTAAVAQARDPELPPAQRQWWYWSRERKRAAAARHRSSGRPVDSR